MFAFEINSINMAVVKQQHITAATKQLITVVYSSGLQLAAVLNANWLLGLAAI